MFERFTENANIMPPKEARRLGHNFVGTEQIFGSIEKQVLQQGS